MEIRSTSPLAGPDDLSLAYTPGVARVCEAIAADPSLTQHYTWVPNTVAVVTDGTAVLGLGDIGPAAAMPVMEGKAVLFKQFGGVDAVPICLDTTDVDEIIETVVRLAPSFGGINLEDISAPALLRDRGPAQASCSTSRSSTTTSTAPPSSCSPRSRTRCKLTGRLTETTRVVISGAGAAGVAVTRILLAAGRQATSRWSTARASCTPVATTSTRSSGRWPVETADVTGRSGTLGDVLAGADVLIGVSGGMVAEEVVATMADDAIIFGLANPTPEVLPDVARRHARVVATGRSDFPNQINNVLAFPGIFRGAFDARATSITEGMKLAAAERPRGPGRRRPGRGPGHPLAVRPAGRSRGGRRGRRGRPARRGGPRADGAAVAARVGRMFAVYAEASPPTTRCPAWWSASGPSPTCRTAGRR